MSEVKRLWLDRDCRFVIYADDHDRIVAEKDVWDRKRIEHIDELQDTIAKQAKVMASSRG